MTPEVHFYQIEGVTLPRVIIDLARKSMERGWHIDLLSKDPPSLSNDLWAGDPISFFPHVLHDDARANENPVVISAVLNEFPNRGAEKALIVTGALEVEEDQISNFTRVMYVFERRLADEVSKARAYWKKFKERGVPLKYWSAENGQWIMKAQSPDG